MTPTQLRAWWDVMKHELSQVTRPLPWHLSSLREFLVELHNAKLVEDWRGTRVSSLELRRLKRECKQLIEQLTRNTRKL